MGFERMPLANRMVLDLLVPLAGARSNFRPHHVAALETLMQGVAVLEAEDRQQWLQRVRAALHLLENGVNLYPRDIGPLVYKNLDQVAPLQMEVGGLIKEIHASAGAAEPDKRFRPVLDLYIVLYEKFYPLLVAPLVATDALLRTKLSLNQLIMDNGRIKHAAIEELEEIRGYPEGLLTRGLNRHLRNSISHRHFEVLSRDTIRMEDRSQGTGQLTWGPSNHLYIDLRDSVLRFVDTCESLLTALIMFDVNNFDVLLERKDIELAPKKVRPDIAEVHLTFFADNYGLDLLEFKEHGLNTLSWKLKVKGQVENGPSEIYVGGPGWSKKYIEEVRTEQLELRGQVYELLRRTMDVHYDYQWLNITVVRSDDTTAGCLRADQTARMALYEGKPIGEVKALMAEDSLPSEKIPVVFKEIPRTA